MVPSPLSMLVCTEDCSRGGIVLTVLPYRLMRRMDAEPNQSSAFCIIMESTILATVHSPPSLEECTTCNLNTSTSPACSIFTFYPPKSCIASNACSDINSACHHIERRESFSPSQPIIPQPVSRSGPRQHASFVSSSITTVGHPCRFTPRFQCHLGGAAAELRIPFDLSDIGTSTVPPSPPPWLLRK
jgi:hypothetical protein